MCKFVTFQILPKSVQWWRIDDQQLLLGYYCQVVLGKSLDVVWHPSKMP